MNIKTLTMTIKVKNAKRATRAINKAAKAINKLATACDKATKAQERMTATLPLLVELETGEGQKEHNCQNCANRGRPTYVDPCAQCDNLSEWVQSKDTEEAAP